MARPIRLEFNGALYHVTSRGDRREMIYEDDADREQFLDVLGDVVGRFNLRCHAYCLMGNHYHLVVETPDGEYSESATTFIRAAIEGDRGGACQWSCGRQMQYS